jgi:hypothetical protein
VTRAGRVLLALLVALPAALASQGVRPAQGPAADFVAPGRVVPLPPAIAAAAELIRVENLAAHVEFLAAPSLEGRGLGGQGLEAAADYVASSLGLAGIAPLGTVERGARPRSAYFQDVPVREITHAAGQVTIDGRVEGSLTSQAFPAGSNCVLPEIAPQTIAGPVVFAGYGIREASLARDDYRDLDVRGKIVLVIGGVPAGPAWLKPELAARYNSEKGRARYAAKLETAAALGAQAVLGMEPVGFAAEQTRLPIATRTYFLPVEDDSPAQPPLVLVSPAVAYAILGAGAEPDLRAGKPRVPTGVTATIRVTGDERGVVGRNVLGAIPGSDPALRGEAVVLGAHVDHLGRKGETIYPGADDNASGVAALIEIAKALAASPRKPPRTVVFAFWTGEEEGHLGSEHYVRHPRWPLERTVLYANLDMIGHPWLPEEIRKLVADTQLPNGEEFLARVKAADFVEPGVAQSAPELCGLLEQAGLGLGLSLHFDRTNGKSGGSDYRAFARKGLPFIRFFGNYFPGYHEPSDKAESLDVAQVRKMARLALATAWLAAAR